MGCRSGPSRTQTMSINFELKLLLVVRSGCRRPYSYANGIQKSKKKEKEVRHTLILKQFSGPNEGNKKSNLI